MASIPKSWCFMHSLFVPLVILNNLHIDEMLAELILRSHKILQSHRWLPLPFINKQHTGYCVQKSGHSYSSQGKIKHWLRTGWVTSPSIWLKSHNCFSISALFLTLKLINEILLLSSDLKTSWKVSMPAESHDSFVTPSPCLAGLQRHLYKKVKPYSVPNANHSICENLWLEQMWGRRKGWFSPVQMTSELLTKNWLQKQCFSFFICICYRLGFLICKEYLLRTSMVYKAETVVYFLKRKT